MTDRMQPSSSAAPTSSSPKPNIWERIRRWWFNFEPSLPDDVRGRMRQSQADSGGLDASSVDSVDNAFLAACDDAAVIEFCDDAGIDLDAVVDEVKAAPVEAHVVERDVVAALTAQARVRSTRRSTSLGLEMFLGCLREGPLARVALEECSRLSVVDVLWFACHGDAEDDGDREGVLGEGDAALVVHGDDFTPPGFLLKVLRQELQCSVGAADEIVGRLRREPTATVNVAPASFQRSNWQRVTEAAMNAGHPLRLRLTRP